MSVFDFLSRKNAATARKKPKKRLCRAAKIYIF